MENISKIKTSYLNSSNSNFAVPSELIGDTINGALTTVSSDNTYITSELELYNSLLNHINATINSSTIHIILYDNISTVPVEFRNENTLLLNKNDKSIMKIILQSTLKSTVLKDINMTDDVNVTEIIELENLNLALRTYLEKCIDIYNDLLTFKMDMSTRLSELVSDYNIRNKFTGTNLFNYYITHDCNSNSVIKLDNTKSSIISNDTNSITINRNDNIFETNETILIDGDENIIKSIDDSISIDDDYKYIINNKLTTLMTDVPSIYDITLYNNCIYNALLSHDGILISYCNNDTLIFNKLSLLTDIDITQITKLNFSMYKSKLILIVEFITINGIHKITYFSMDSDYKFTDPLSFDDISLYDGNDYNDLIIDNDNLMYMSKSKLYKNNEYYHLPNMKKLNDVRFNDNTIIVAYTDTNDRDILTLNGKNILTTNEHRITKIDYYNSSIIAKTELNKLICVTKTGDVYNLESDIIDFNICKNIITFIKRINENSVLYKNKISKDDYFNYTKIYDDILSNMNGLSLLNINDISDTPSDIVVIKNSTSILLRDSLYLKEFNLLTNIKLINDITLGVDNISRSVIDFNNGVFNSNSDINVMTLEGFDINNINILAGVIHHVNMDLISITYRVLMGSNVVEGECTIIESDDDSITFTSVLNLINIDKLNIFIKFSNDNPTDGIVSIFGSIE